MMICFGIAKLIFVAIKNKKGSKFEAERNTTWKKLTVPALSRLSGVPVRTIENIEKREECTVTNAKKLAAALKISTIKINQLPKSNQAKTSVFATFVITNKATVEEKEKFHIDTSFLVWYNISIPKKGEELSLFQAITW